MVCWQHRQRKASKRERGTAYVLVLAITTLLVTLGLAATQLAQGQIEQGESEQDVAKARLAAQYTQDYIHKLRTGDTTWRDGLLTSRWYYFTNLDGVDIWHAYVDQIDGDLADDYSEPFVLYTLARSGSAYRSYIAEYSADEDGNLTLNVSTLRQGVFNK